MRPAGYILLVAVVSAPLISASNGYLPVVGPKPLIFGRPAVPVALALAKLPALARETPLETSHGKNSGSVLLPPPKGHEPAGHQSGASTGTNMLSAASGEPGLPGAGIGPGDPAAHPADPATGGAAGNPPLSPLVPGFGIRLPSESSLPLLSPQMLVPFFMAPGVTNRTGIIAPIQFTPAQPAPAASSTATYEQN